MSAVATTPDVRKRALSAAALSACFLALNLTPALDPMVYQPLVQDTPLLVGGVLLTAALALSLGFFWASKPDRPLGILLLPASIFALCIASQHLLNQPQSGLDLAPDEASLFRAYELKTMAALGTFGAMWASSLVAVAAIHVSFANARKGRAMRFGVGIPIGLLLTGLAPSFAVPASVPVVPLLLQLSALIPLCGMAAIGFGVEGDEESRASQAMHYAWAGALTALSVAPLVIASYSTSLLSAASALGFADLPASELSELWSMAFADADSVLTVHALSAAGVAAWGFAIPFALQQKNVAKPVLVSLALGLVVIAGLSLWLKSSMTSMSALLVGA